MSGVTWGWIQLVVLNPPASTQVHPTFIITFQQLYQWKQKSWKLHHIQHSPLWWLLLKDYCENKQCCEWQRKGFKYPTSPLVNRTPAEKYQDLANENEEQVQCRGEGHLRWVIVELFLFLCCCGFIFDINFEPSKQIILLCAGSLDLILSAVLSSLVFFTIRIWFSFCVNFNSPFVKLSSLQQFRLELTLRSYFKFSKLQRLWRQCSYQFS